MVDSTTGKERLYIARSETRHDLKNPLTIVKGYSQFLKRGTLPPEVVSEIKTTRLEYLRETTRALSVHLQTY